MTDLNTLEQILHVTMDKSGNPVVQIPLEVWNEYVVEARGGALSHQQKVRHALQYLDENPGEETDQWWDEFDQFLKENRVNFPERDLGLGDE